MEIFTMRWKGEYRVKCPKYRLLVDKKNKT